MYIGLLLNCVVWKIGASLVTIPYHYYTKDNGYASEKSWHATSRNKNVRCYTDRYNRYDNSKEKMKVNVRGEERTNIKM